MKKSILALMIIIFSGFTAMSEDLGIERFLGDNNYFVFDENIHSIEIRNGYGEWCQPIIELGSNDKIHVTFDDFDAIGKNYKYTFVHCDPTWHKSNDIIRSDYMTGYYFEDYINDYSQSFNTLRDYTHYSVSFPNENINIGYSGNYALVVYEENEYEPSFMARFYVYERKTSIVMTEGFSKNPSLYNTVQRVTFTIDCHNNILREPYNSLTVVIQQNNKPFLAQYAFAPKYITGTSYVYDYDDKYEFNGNYEFRNIDISSLKLLTRYVSEIDVVNGEYYVYTHGIAPWRTKTYQRYLDNDGEARLYISPEDGFVATEGEYAYVNLHIKANVPMQNDEMYVCGDFNGWQMNETNRMVYNYDRGEYEVSLYLKQGIYDYMYILRQNDTGTLDETYIDGTFLETQNRYSIMVYYHPSGERYSRLVGYSLINSVDE